MIDKITLFGSSGFLGTHLKDNLDGEVISVNFREHNWRNSISKHSSVFINCIGKAHDHKGTASDADYFAANLDVVKELYQQFVASNAELFIHISSIAAVEETERSEIITENSDCQPVSHYGVSKRAGEKFLLDQIVPNGKKIIILRPTMIHGERDKGNLKMLYALIAKGIPYPLGSYNNSRTFASIDNVIYIINQIIRKNDIVPSGIYNICDDASLSTRKIIEIIGRVRGIKPLILSVPKKMINLLGKIGDSMSLPINSKRLEKMTSNLVVSNAKIKQALGIDRLPISAEDGMEKSIQSFSKNL